MWRNLPTVYDLLQSFEDRIVPYEDGTVTRTAEAFSAQAAADDLPPAVCMLGLLSLLPGFETELVLTERMLARLHGWTQPNALDALNLPAQVSQPDRQAVWNDIRSRLLDDNDDNFRAAWAEAAFYVWLIEAGVDFQPSAPIPTPAAPLKKGKSPDADACLDPTVPDWRSWWDAKALVVTEFSEVQRGLEQVYRDVCRTISPQHDIMFSLDPTVDRVGAAGQLRSLVGEESHVRGQAAAFSTWLQAQNRQGQSFPIYSVGDPSCEGRPSASVRVHLRCGFRLSSGDQSKEEVAYQVRWKLGARQRQFHATEPNVRVAILDPFSPYLAEEHVWKAAHGYRFWDDARRKDITTEGVLRLTGSRKFSRKEPLLEHELTDRLGAVVYFAPQLAFADRVFPNLTAERHSRAAVMFLRPDLAGSHLEEIGRRLGCEIQVQSEDEETRIGPPAKVFTV